MANNIINFDLIKKINSFLKKVKSLKFIDPNLFETIDGYKDINGIDFNYYFLEYIAGLPKLDFETVIKISREVYKQYGKEHEFDKILERLISSHSIDNGSLNPDDDNCITKAAESKILLSGTYYDVIMLCHEIGHKIRYNNTIGSTDIMDSFLFETPSIIMEFSASNYLRDNYGVDINAEQLRKLHVLSIKRDNSIENIIFLTVIKLLKERKLNAINLYKEFIKNPIIMEYFSIQGSSIETCLDEGISAYSYDIGYILGSFANNRDDKLEILNMLLKYKDTGINMPFTIDEEIIKNALDSQQYSK